jgi:type IV pilus assembly protein PilW
MTNQLRSVRGFTLVEIMVGLVIGLIASVIIFQVFSVSERQKRTTTGAADAQSSGAIAMRMVERDVQMAGWGIEEKTFGACTTIYSYYNDGATAGSVPGLQGLVASAVITDGASNAPDSVAISYFDNPANMNFKFALTSLTASQSPANGASDLLVGSSYGCVANNLMLAKQGANCTLMQITSVTTNPDGSAVLKHDTGAAPTFNPPATYITSNAWPYYTTGATVQCLPLSKNYKGLFTRTYRVNRTAATQPWHLELLEPNSAGVVQTLPIASDIVDLQAEYGVADAGSQDVTSWQKATGAWASPLSAANTARIKAVRISMVARSGEYEKPDSSGSCVATTSAMAAGWSSWATFDPTKYSADWQCYRYKVFETVVPLRNIIWAKL